MFVEDQIKKRNSESNEKEFLAQDSTLGCARVCLVESDRRFQMKTAVVDASSVNMFVGNTVELESKTGKELFREGLDERIRNVETHLGILQPPSQLSLIERVKILEDKIMKIEQNFPQIAERCFNYGSAEALASSRPGGRVSTLLEARPPPSKKRREDPAAAVKLRLAELSKKLSK